MTPPDEPPHDEAVAPEPRAAQALEALMDPRLEGEVRGRIHRLVVRPPRLPAAPSLDLHLDPVTWGVGFIAVRERDVPPQLTSDLRERVPQALLRDLHRPVMQSVWHPREPVTEPRDPAGKRAMAELRAALVRPPAPVVPRGTDAMVDYLRWRRAYMAEPWQPHRPDDAPRRHAETPTVGID